MKCEKNVTNFLMNVMLRIGHHVADSIRVSNGYIQGEKCRTLQSVNS